MLLSKGCLNASVFGMDFLFHCPFCKDSFSFAKFGKNVYLSSLSVQFSTKQCLHNQALKTSLALLYLSGKVRMSTLGRTFELFLCTVLN